MVSGAYPRAEGFGPIAIRCEQLRVGCANPLDAPGPGDGRMTTPRDAAGAGDGRIKAPPAAVLSAFGVTAPARPLAGGVASLCLFETNEKPAHLHLAFMAHSRAQVEAFYHAALEAGGIDNGPPGFRPKYHANYYAAFVIGPDGHNVEAVYHDVVASE